MKTLFQRWLAKLFGVDSALALPGTSLAAENRRHEQTEMPPPLMAFPPFDQSLVPYVSADDPVRYVTVLLALQTLRECNIEGSVAELGVYRGDLSVALRAAAPERRLYLFDTFDGFPAQDLAYPDDRFADTSLEFVRNKVGPGANVIFRPGWFPATAQGLENERFAFVMLDADLYNPTLAGLEFFYPRLVPGGYLFAHDYNSPESDWGTSRAIDHFLGDKSEKVIEIPDKWGSVAFRKI